MDGYGEAASQQQLRSGMDAGPDKVRRRFTAASRPLQGKIVVNQAQFSFFKNWYDNVLLGGTLRFGWVEPWSDDTITNLLDNPGFEDGVTGWVGWQGTPISTSGGIYLNCCELTQQAGITGSDVQVNMADLIPGDTYSFGGYVKSGTAGNESGGNIGSWDTDGEIANIDFTSSEDWEYYHFDFTAVYATTYVGGYKGSATEGTIFFDEFSLVDITTKPTEFRFTEPPTYEAVGGAYIVINMSLEILP